MLARLLLLFIVVPVIELFLLIEVGQVIGTLPTIGLIILTGAVGAFLARRQGLQVVMRVRGQLQTGQLPTDALFDGAVILIAGAFLMTPGILTDTVGFLFLIPATRRFIKGAIQRRIEQAMQDGRIITHTYGGRAQPRRDEPEDVIIIDQDDYT